MRVSICILLGLLPVLGVVPVFAQEFRDVRADTWPAIDALGRELPGHSEVGDPRADRTVGMFYFVWHGQHGTGGPYDITKILEANPSDPQWGPEHAMHHWGESELGYYLADDDYVVRRHAYMLTNAGVDCIIFDITNSFPYIDNARNLLDVYTAMNAEGVPTPKLVFFAYNGDYATAVQTVYDQLYAGGEYEEHWFRWEGRPLLLTPTEGLSQEVLDTFEIRTSWAWSTAPWFGDGQHKWPWLDNYPQGYGWDENPAVPEQTSVCVAQHPTSNIGRSYHNGSQPSPANWQTDWGLCFEEQWQRALQLDPAFIFVTGWNEWTAQRFITDTGRMYIGQYLPPGGSFFVDAYIQEYNRDIEPMKGGHSDNYYYQLIDYVRRYKGARPVEAATAHYPISIDGSFEDWQTVLPAYLDHRGDAVQRNHPGWGSAGPYVNETGRNDFLVTKTTQDSEYVYFYARCQDMLIGIYKLGWVDLFINADRRRDTGWEGYEIAANLTFVDGTTFQVQRSVNRWDWTPVAEAPFRAAHGEIEFAVPRSVFGDNPMDEFEFKWADNMQHQGVSESPGDSEGWEAWNAVANLRRSWTTLLYDVDAADPFIGTDGLDIDAANGVVTLRMKVSRAGPCQLFWTTLGQPFWDQNKSVVFEADTAGEWREYVLEPGANAVWGGIVTGLRLDTLNEAPGAVEIDYLRVLDAPASGSLAPADSDGGRCWEFNSIESDRIRQFALSGDAAPDDRFNYLYRYEPAAEAPGWTAFE